MSLFQIQVLPINKVENHPNADRLSLNRVRGFIAVSNKKDGSHRYKVKDLVALVPEGTWLPNGMLKRYGYWDEKKDKGFLGGETGNVVAPINLRGVVSRPIILPIEYDSDMKASYITNGDGHKMLVREGQNVSDFLQAHHHVDPYLPDLPKGEKRQSLISYNVEDIRLYPDVLQGHQVVITEMLHGVLCIVGYDRTLKAPFFVTSGVSPDNIHNIDPKSVNVYTVMADPIWKALERYQKEMPGVEKFYLFGEIIGPGVQDLDYGQEHITFRALDIQMGMIGGGVDSIPFGFIGVRKYELFKWLGLAYAPILWGGEYDHDVVQQLTNGPSSLGAGLRKGVVITSENESLINGMRPIFKNLSDKFLIRMGGTDYK